MKPVLWRVMNKYPFIVFKLKMTANYPHSIPLFIPLSMSLSIPLSIPLSSFALIPQIFYKICIEDIHET